MAHPHGGQGGLQSLAALSPEQLAQLRALSPVDQRALASGFDIDNPTVTGGSTFLDFLERNRNLTNQRQLGQAAVGQDLFSSLLGAQLQANRRPISIVDQLMLQGQVGSQSPLSQASDERLARFTRPGQNPILQSLIDRLDIFSSGLNTDPTNPASGFGSSAFIGDVQGRVKALAHGGTLVVDPNKRKAGAGAVAGPVTINDRTGKTVAVAGEGGAKETIDVQPVGEPTRGIGPVGGSVFDPKAGLSAERGINPVGQNVALDRTLPGTLSRSERFRAEELMRLRPDLDIERITAIARHPEGLQALIGGPPDPRAEAAQRLADSIGNDNRFTDAFVRALAIGRSPRPTETTARDFTTLSPFNQDILKGVIGEDLFPQFGFELNDQSPLGTRARQAVTGGVRV